MTCTRLPASPLTHSSIRISTAGATSSSDTLDNLLAATPLVVDLIEDNWENVLSVGIKTSTSVLLPIWSSKLEGRFDIKEKAKAAESGDVDMEASEGKSKKNKGKGKDKKRPAPEAEVEAAADEDKVEKKTKASPVKPAKKAKAVGEAKEEKAVVAEPKKAAGEKVKKSLKKSSSLGSGGAGKRSKEAILGKKK